MERYSNLEKGSKVSGYEIGSDYINVWFSGKDYPKTFSSEKIGKNRVETMKKMAKEGQGLHRYIKRHISNLGLDTK